MLWGIVETCVRQEALTEAGLTTCLNTNHKETRTVEEVNDEMPFLDAQKQLLSDMADLLGIPTDGNDENHSLPLQFGAKVQRTKGTKKAFKQGDQPPQQQQKKTRLAVETERNEVTSSKQGVLSSDAAVGEVAEVTCLVLPVPHDASTMVEENVYLARYNNSSANSADTAAVTATAVAATASTATTTTAATSNDKESSSNQITDVEADDDALYPIRILGNGPLPDRLDSTHYTPHATHHFCRILTTFSLSLFFEY